MDLLPESGATNLGLVMLAALAAGASRGFSGFGAALIFMPLAGMVAGPQLAAPILLVIDGVFASPLIPAAWKQGDRADVALMLVGALIGVPLGALILHFGSPLTLRWLTAGIAATMLALLKSGWRYRGRPNPFAKIAVGGISGLFSGIAQIGGPVLMSYFLGLGAPHMKIRANIILFFAVSTVISAVSYAFSGLFSPQIFKYALFAGPAYGLGAFGGSKMFRLASPAVFRNCSLALIAIAVVVSLPVFG